MSRQLISRSPDLQKLQNEGYDIEVRGGHLLIKQVPYVNSQRQIRYGTLVSNLSLAGDVTTQPNPHTAMIVGEMPCNEHGVILHAIHLSSGDQYLGDGITINHSFSTKPTRTYYLNYHEKITTYVNILASHAQAIDPGVTATPFPVIEDESEEGPFVYIDTASARAQIGQFSHKLEGGRVGIVGLGGTGSYVLDLIAKTPLKEIRLIDGDKFSQHNAFRSPGAASAEVLKAEPKKVDYFRDIYGAIKRGIVAYGEFLTDQNLHLLDDLDFVFLCIDNGKARRLVVDRLQAMGIAFIDVGAGVERSANSLHGILRATLSLPGQESVFKTHVPFEDGPRGGEYSQNIQLADLNAMNAIMAVARWKRLRGFYADLVRENHTTYTIATNKIISEVIP